MRLVPTEKSIGKVLSCDLTQYLEGAPEKIAFKKGHLVEKGDISKLLDIGRTQLFVSEVPEGFIHENEAAALLARHVCAEGIELSASVTGKVMISAAKDGVFKVDRNGLVEFNMYDGVALSCIHANQFVRKGTEIAAVKVIPLFEDEEVLNVIKSKISPIVSVKSLSNTKVGLVVTGNEVFHNRIKDRATSILERKISKFGSTIIDRYIKPDLVTDIKNAIVNLHERGAELIVVVGGMSVDPDDVTPSAIVKSGAEVVISKAPTNRGAAFVLSYLNGAIVLGVPACIVHYEITIFDLLLPRILSDEILTKKDVIELAYGGLCSNCVECKFPNCSFGKI